MTPDIERLAKQAGIVLDYYYVAKDLDVLAKFAALVAEECAKHCESARFMTLSPSNQMEVARCAGMRSAAKDLAHSIRRKFPAPALSSDKPEAK